MNIEVGMALLSEPFLLDPNFERTVVLMVQHSEFGSLGFIINQKLDITSDDLIPQFNFPTMPIFQGGPVGMDTLNTLYYSGKPLEGSVKISNDLYWGGNIDQITDAINQNIISKENIKLIQGYSGWAPNQLQNEIDNNDWIIAGISASDVVSPEILGNDFWKKVVSSLGDDYKLMVNFPKNPSLN
jgi:putative transcriptional regulator